MRTHFLNSHGEVIADGSLGQRQLCGDGGDAGTAQRGGQHVLLPATQRVVALAQRREGEFRIDHALAGHHAPDGRCQLGCGRILE